MYDTPMLRLSSDLQEVTPDHDVPGQPTVSCKVSQKTPWELLLNTAENQTDK